MTRLLRRCVIAGGTGSVGSMFAALLAKAGAEVSLIDLHFSAVKYKLVQCDITSPTPEAAAAIQSADLVMLSLPEEAALHAVFLVSRLMKSDSLLVHTLSVQKPMALEIEALGISQEVVGLNPMFAPDLGIAGRPVAAIIRNEGPRAAELLDLLSGLGGRVERLEAEEHDGLVAAMQALTHASILSFGLALSALHVDIAKLSALAPPPHSTLLALLARISSGTPEVYWDVQTANPNASTARSMLIAAADRLHVLTTAESAFHDFTDVLNNIREMFGDELASYQALCSSIFKGSSRIL
ncbi:prephenate dehydrogenase dimerization domain-containing protein [Paenibacillus glufosinatiresistens]|uniref:prephenate dehydrogenase dimerization domain-containing protein n=1 Tax=Paenibacillus glufosinatiresistens TaxID=3070657 RepID=UPI00286E4D3B|nr:prephenate dehydrogenase dimerization domain-containing protein [Paenibacillus sp. YX.27]